MKDLLDKLTKWFSRLLGRSSLGKPFDQKVEQSQDEGITALELVHQYVNTLATDADTGYTDQDYLNSGVPFDRLEFR